MSKDKSLTLSIIIPVYNEEAHLKACLEALAVQTEAPNEIIVVDNNSTDGSVKIAQTYSFVKVIKEARQGLIPARNKGFNIAKSDILARIDADSIIGPDWAARLRQDFSVDDVVGVTGPALTDPFIFLHWPKITLWPTVYFWWSDAFFGVRILWGANMAIRRSVWEKIKNEADTDDKNVHEDQDLSLLIAGRGWRVLRDRKLHMTIGGQSYAQWPKFYEYLKRRWNTKRLHTQRGTLAGPDANKLPKWKTWPLVVLAAVPGLPIITCSFLFWQVERVAIFFTGKNRQSER